MPPLRTGGGIRNLAGTARFDTNAAIQRDHRDTFWGDT